jgi:NodT family efflux transporter outer membrane factor (OMF) lipoprotein
MAARHHFAPWAIAALLAGCALGPDYRKPASDIPAAFRATAATQEAAWPSRSWWTGFGSPELDRLIDDARAHDFDILAAIARIREADQQVRIAGAPLLPGVTANTEAQYTKQGVTAGSLGSASFRAARSGHYVDSRFYSLLPSVSYELDFWGGLRATQQAAEASALFSRFDQQTVALTAVSSVATTYFTALAYEDRLAVAQRNLRDAQEILTAIQAREAAGTASLLDVSQQQALVAGLQAEVPSFRSQAQQEINGLAILVGRPPERVEVAAGTLTTLALPEVSPGLPSDLLARRPDVASAEAQLVAANANIRAARAAFFPQVTLTSQEGWESSALSTLVNPGSVLFTLAGSVAQTVFDNGQKGGQFQYDRARYDELLADYQKAVVQAFTDVENGLVAYRYATEQERLEAVAVATAQQAADIARAQVEAGTSDIVTALQAQETLYGDLDTLAQVRLARFTALVQLYQALGGGWTRADTPPPASSIYHGIL